MHWKTRAINPVSQIEHKRGEVAAGTLVFLREAKSEGVSRVYALGRDGPNKHSVEKHEDRRRQ